MHGSWSSFSSSSLQLELDLVMYPGARRPVAGGDKFALQVAFGTHASPAPRETTQLGRAGLGWAGSQELESSASGTGTQIPTQCNAIATLARHVSDCLVWCLGVFSTP